MSRMSETNQPVGEIIRDLRVQKRITGIQLSERAGISQSKLSKIETGSIVRPLKADIDRLLDFLCATDAQRRRVEWSLGQPRAIFIKPFATMYDADSWYQMELQAKIVQMFSACVPAILQTIPWQASILEQQLLSAEQHTTAVRSMLLRQDLLLGGQRQYHIVMYESALYSSLSNPDVHIAQIDRIERVAESPHVKIGIIPFQAGLTPTDVINFLIYDEKYASGATLSTEITTSDELECTMYVNVFKALASIADYNEGALTLLTKAKRFINEQREKREIS